MQLSTTVNSKIIRALLIILATFLLFDCQFLLSDACYNRFLTPRPGPTHMAAVSARLRPEVKIKISARVKPDLNGKFQFGPEAGPARPERKIQIWNRTRPGLKRKFKFWSRTSPANLFF